MKALTLAAALTAILSGPVARAEEVKVPQTAEEHLSMAKMYQEKAATWRAEAAYHREMAAAYKKAHPDLKSGTRNPWTVEMEQHCRALVVEADKAAAEAEEMAKFHKMHGLELQGK